jgi:hypothetical protein
MAMTSSVLARPKQEFMKRLLPEQFDEKRAEATDTDTVDAVLRLPVALLVCDEKGIARVIRLQAHREFMEVLGHLRMVVEPFDEAGLTVPVQINEPCPFFRICPAERPCAVDARSARQGSLRQHCAIFESLRASG